VIERLAEISGLEAVIFLDVDGVLHGANPKHSVLMFRPHCMELLKEIVQHTGAKIVLSTSWRTTEDGRSAVAAKLAEYDIPSFVSRTPSLAQFQRPKEILAWVTKYSPGAWVSIDDWPLHEDPRMEGHFVQTRNRHGLQPDTAFMVKQMFARQGVCEEPAPILSTATPLQPRQPKQEEVGFYARAGHGAPTDKDLKCSPYASSAAPASTTLKDVKGFERLKSLSTAKVRGAPREKPARAFSYGGSGGRRAGGVTRVTKVEV